MAWECLQTKECTVTLFDGEEPCASSIAGGLMHPYPGEHCLRSKWATEGMEHSRALFRVAEEAIGRPVYREGVLRRVQNDAQRARMQEHAKVFHDVEQIETDAFWIPSAATVFSSLYLKGLKKAIAQRGANIISQTIQTLRELESFDTIILAVGAGICKFPECAHLPIQLVKGQILHCLGTKIPEKSVVSKGYVAIAEDPHQCVVGSTYEHIDSFQADIECATSLLVPQISLFFPAVQEFVISDCQAGVRVVRRGNYLPLVVQLNAKTWVVTALGSRGLLYHALLAKRHLSTKA